jgi:hypothetical protein
MMIPNSNYLKFFPDAELPVELPESVRSGIDLQLKLTQVLRGKLTHLSGGVVSK